MNSKAIEVKFNDVDTAKSVLQTKQRVAKMKWMTK